MKYITENQHHTFLSRAAVLLAFALVGCASAVGSDGALGQEVEESTSAVSTLESAGASGDTEAPVAVDRVLSSEATLGKERFGGGHPDPWTPTPEPGPKPEK